MSDCSNDNSGNNKFDLAVIGAGSAGFSAAITAAEGGAQVLVVGHGTIGGTCVNVGCVPSKALIRAAQTLHIASHAAQFDGLEASAKVTDWAALIAQKQQLVDDLRKAKYIDILPAYNSVSYVEGKARFDNDGLLQVNGDRVEADKIILATGTRPALPSIPGIDTIDYLTSTTALELAHLPRSLLIIGAGYIGAEIAQIFARAGVKVTLTGRRGLLPEAEPEISSALTGYFADEGIDVVSGFSYQRIEQSSGRVTLHITRAGKSQVLQAEKVMIACGRTPNSDGLNLKAAGIETGKNGGIRTNSAMRTSADHIYAAGDVTGRDQFVYMAAYGAKIAAKNALNGDTMEYDNTVMPAVVFSDPQVASVGLGEEQARQAGFDVKTSVLTLDNLPRALAARDTRGLIKLIADAKTKKLLGGHILAPEGADSIQTIAIAIKAGMTYEQLGAMIFPYLTTVEGLKLAAQTFDMDVKKLSCCAG
jgi:mercuric reductase